MGDGAVVAMAVAVTVGIWIARPLPGWWRAWSWCARRRAAGGRRRRAAVLFAALAVLGSGLSARAWAGARPVPRARVTGTLTLLTDPATVARACRRSLASAAPTTSSASTARQGGRLPATSPASRCGSTARCVRRAGAGSGGSPARHVVGELAVDRFGDWSEGSRAAAAANRVRRLLATGVDGMAPVDRALFLGLVIGDDRAEPAQLVDDFRAAGLSHLTAVSGQNVALVLVAAGPLLRRLRPAPRWIVTIGLVGWFALLTRFEPSVLRASGMALLAATAFWRGWKVAPIRLLALTVCALELIDPLLVWSVGWWLSVSATGGARPCWRVRSPARLPGPRWVARPARRHHRRPARRGAGQPPGLRSGVAARPARQPAGGPRRRLRDGVGDPGRTGRRRAHIVAGGDRRRQPADAAGDEVGAGRRRALRPARSGLAGALGAAPSRRCRWRLFIVVGVRRRTQFCQGSERRRAHHAVADPGG